MTPEQSIENAIMTNADHVAQYVSGEIWEIYSRIQNSSIILYIGIGVLTVLGVVIIVNQIKIKKMLRKLTEEQDKP